MKAFLVRALAILAGLVVGMLVVTGPGPWRERLSKPDDAPAAPVQRERAPDTRV